MKHETIIKLLLKISAKIKPVLVKALPIELLRVIKKKMIAHSMSKIDDSISRTINCSEFPDGINLIGYIKGEIGLGQSCRLVADGLSSCDYPFTIYNYEQISAMRNSDESHIYRITNTLPYNINLIHINPYELPLAHIQLGDASFESRYNIAFWLWELEVFPDEWISSLKLVNEIWTPSEFASDSIRTITEKPVKTIPYPISAPTDERFDRKFFHLPNNIFLFLCMYDCNSTMERKNPMGAIAAYKRAFYNKQEDVGLVIKVNNPQQKDLDILQKELADHPNIYIITDILQKVHVNSLIQSVDVFVSLHRAEGFGLVPAEAMLLGTPCIATNWSSNTEFMNSDVACMVDYKFVNIDHDCGPYKSGNRWADPDIEQAADYMTKIYENKTFYADIANKAQQYIESALSLENAAKRINKRIQEIYDQYK